MPKVDKGCVTHFVCPNRLVAEGGEARCCNCTPCPYCGKLTGELNEKTLPIYKKLRKEGKSPKEALFHIGWGTLTVDDLKEAAKKSNEDQRKTAGICEGCGFEDGHSPVCGSKEGIRARKVAELLSAVMGGEYGTKNRVQLILRLQEIKGLC